MKRIFSAMFIYLLTSFSMANATFISGSTGTDGAFAPTVNTEVALPANGILNYTTVNIPSGVTVTFFKNATNTPVYMLATDDVTIAGTISVSGTSYGTAPIAGKGGPGGYDGGQGSIASLSAANGVGPGGGGGGHTSTDWKYSGRGGGGGYGLAGASSGDSNGAGGATYGNSKLIPLIGGSGGGGAAGFNDSRFNPNYGGGGGGGAILIASSTSITITGTISANGGIGNCQEVWGWSGVSGGGSGGAIRLIANAIGGTGIISAKGGVTTCTNSGGAGRIRLEAYTNNYTPMTEPSYTFEAPGSVFVTNLPTLQITSLGGVSVAASPTGSYATPDVTLPSATINPVAVALSGANIPVGTTVTLTVTPQYGSASSGTGTLSGTEQSSTSSININLTAGTSTIIMAQATYTMQTAMYYEGEKIDNVRVASTLGGESKAVYITEKGREVPAEKLLASLTH